MKWLEKLKNYIETIKTKNKYKRLPDEEIVEKIPEIVDDENIETHKIVNNYIKSEEKREEVLVEHAEDLKPGEINKVIENLPPESQVSVYQENNLIGKKLARVKKKDNLTGILNAKGINSYEELYRLIEDGINDYELVDMLKSIEQNPEKQYNSDQVLRIISKQMTLYLQRYGKVLGGHVGELLRALQTEEEKRKVPETVRKECKIREEKLIESKRIYNRLTEQEREDKIAELKRGVQEGTDHKKEWSEWKSLIYLKGYQSEDLETIIQGIIDFEKNRIEERNEAAARGELRD